MGVVFDDKNGNGQQDEGEPGLAGVVLILDPGTSRLQILPAERRTTTNSEGNYRFDNVPIGAHRLQIVSPLGYLPTTPVIINVGTQPHQTVPVAPAGFIRAAGILYLPITLK